MINDESSTSTNQRLSGAVGVSPTPPPNAFLFLTAHNSREVRRWLARLLTFGRLECRRRLAITEKGIAGRLLSMALCVHTGRIDC
jgi:hypothetical protein